MKRLSLILPILALTFVVPACDSPEDEAEFQALDEESDLEVVDPHAADDESPAWNESLDLTSTGSTAWKCHCWTTCSSNGKNWTKSYWVGSYGSLATCHKKAKDECHDKAKDYDYANGGCGTHP